MNAPKLNAIIAGTLVTLAATCCHKAPQTKGDLAFLELQGDVKSMTNDLEYTFDKEGLLYAEGMKDTLDFEGKRCINLENGYEQMTSLAKPFSRTYDENGRLVEIYPSYESMQCISYNEDGTVSELEWFDEGYSGKVCYEYKDGFVSHTTMYDFGFQEEEGEVTTSDVVAYEVDKKGNWTRRFVLYRDSEGNVTDHVLETRQIQYFSGRSTLDPSRSKLLLTGSVGASDMIIGLNAFDGEEPLGMMIYKNRIYTITDADCSFPALKLTARRLDGKGRDTLIEGSLSAKPDKSESLTYDATVRESVLINGLEQFTPEVHILLSR